MVIFLEPPNPTLYQYESSSGLYYDPATSLYYDSNSQYYWDASTQKWLVWNAPYQTYLPYDLVNRREANNEVKNELVNGTPTDVAFALCHLKFLLLFNT